MFNPLYYAKIDFRAQPVPHGTQLTLKLLPKTGTEINF